jgi:hypothetical protein
MVFVGSRNNIVMTRPCGSARIYRISFPITLSIAILIDLLHLGNMQDVKK